MTSSHGEVMVYKKTSAIGDKISIFKKDLTPEKRTLAAFCNSKKVLSEIFDLIKAELAARSVFRISIVITADYEIPDLGEGATNSSDNDTFSLRTKGVVVNEFEGGRRVKRKIRSLLLGALQREEDLLTRGSGWRFQHLQSCDILLYDVCYVASKK